MLFNSYNFILLFAPCVLLVYWLLPNPKTRLIWVTLASYFFYGSFDLLYLPLLLFVTGVNFLAGAQIAHGTRKGLWLTISLTSTLGLLVFFKYYDFGAEQINGLLRNLSVAGRLEILDLLLPVGISFYVFQSLTYTLDLYYGRTQPAESFWHFAGFVAFFPTLLSGPILRWTTQRESLLNLGRPTLDQGIEGCKFIVIGLAKKVLLADFIASGIVNPLFNAYEANGFFLAWLAALAYGAQLYLDFSGYSDMAIGLGHLLGLSLPRNFARPYQASNIGEFWNRWHISLSTWFRDYFFFPFSRALLRRGGNKVPDLTRAAAHLATMSLIGIWHGAILNFLLWGVFHGVLLVIYHQTRSWRIIRWRVVSWGLTIAAVSFGWILFTSASLEKILTMWRSMLGLRGFESPSAFLAQIPEFQLGLVLVGLFAMLFLPDTWSLRLPRNVLAAIALGLLAAIAFGMLARPTPFLYFQF
jgi:alginate O-acetyltransferase complex protein AlgI